MDRCNREIFERGVPLLAASTGPVGGANVFGHWVRKVARLSGQRVDWHYSGGIAQVLVLGDHDMAMTAAMQIALPSAITIIQWYKPGSSGLYREGVTQVPDDVVAVFTDPLSGKQVMMHSDGEDPAVKKRPT